MVIRVRCRRQDERSASMVADMLRRVGVGVEVDSWVSGADGATGSVDGARSCPQGDAVVLLWSAAAGAAWGGIPEAGLPSGPTATRQGRVVPVRIDDTPLPSCLGGLRQVRLTQGAYRMTEAAAAMIAHLGSRAASPPAVRGDFSERHLVISDFGALGLFAACPRCGVGSERLRPYVTVDHLSDRALRLVICGACGWQDACDL